MHWFSPVFSNKGATWRNHPMFYVVRGASSIDRIHWYEIAKRFHIFIFTIITLEQKAQIVILFDPRCSAQFSFFSANNQLFIAPMILESRRGKQNIFAPSPKQSQIFMLGTREAWKPVTLQILIRLCCEVCFRQWLSFLFWFSFREYNVSKA